jgi:hypothetical protein
MTSCQQEPCSAVWDAAKALDVEYPGLVHLNSYDAECKYHGPRPFEEAVVDGLIEVGESVIGHGGGQQYMLTLLFKGRRVRVWYLRWRSIRELPLPPMQDGDEVVGTALPSWMDWYYLPNAGGMARELAAHHSDNSNDING